MIQAQEGETTPLGVTPRTPGLLREAALPGGDDVEDDDDDDDDEWERISAVSETHTTTPSIVSGRTADDDDDHDSIIVLGELELEDAPMVASQTKNKHESPGWAGGKITYAAALGKPANA
jgi:hypothetical protein